MLHSLPEIPWRLQYLYMRDCNMLRSLPELPLRLKLLEARNCKRLQSLPEIRSCLEELDASVLEKLSKRDCDKLFTWVPRSEISFEFANCLKLNEKANNEILADSRLRIQHMAIASLRLGHEIANNEVISQDLAQANYFYSTIVSRNPGEAKGPRIVLPGSEIPDWFSNQISGSSMSIQLPPHAFCRNLIGFALCAVVDFKRVYSDWWSESCARGKLCVQCQIDLEIKTLSETRDDHLLCHLACIPDFNIDADHVVLGFNPCVIVGFLDGNDQTTVSFTFFSWRQGSFFKVKRCGVCPVYANPNETNPNTFTLNFANEVWKLDHLASASGTCDEEEL